MPTITSFPPPRHHGDNEIPLVEPEHSPIEPNDGSNLSQKIATDHQPDQESPIGGEVQELLRQYPLPPELKSALKSQIDTAGKKKSVSWNANIQSVGTVLSGLMHSNTSPMFDFISQIGVKKFANLFDGYSDSMQLVLHMQNVKPVSQATHVLKLIEKIVATDPNEVELKLHALLMKFVGVGEVASLQQFFSPYTDMYYSNLTGIGTGRCALQFAKEKSDLLEQYSKLAAVMGAVDETAFDMLKKEYFTAPIELNGAVGTIFDSFEYEEQGGLDAPGGTHPIPFDPTKSFIVLGGEGDNGSEDSLEPSRLPFA
ncbi:hypothetical protein [Variovorax saccharolyticus]|uniref:hypothetical protein n=1 Tax=Variovorax saccharolyticus TaxID=3053516 RepID=UPI002577F9B8|nr:hypothetical protein [Variovorax sp. J31P216]MDM0030455.1 hypothetical protein [Variovorax sp. J31P216]